MRPQGLPISGAGFGSSPTRHLCVHLLFDLPGELHYSDRVASKGQNRRLSGMAAVLANAYDRTPGGYVAFLDESFELSTDRPTFYLLSSVVAHRDDLDELRKGLRAEVDGDYWHTTESLQTDPGREKAVQLSTYLGDEDGSEVCVVSCKTPVEEGRADDARQACFEQLLSALCKGADPLPGPIHLMILEQRGTQHDRSFDTKIVKDLRASSKICRHCQLKQASPRDEALLWLPDLVSSAVRRSMTHRETDLLAPIEKIVTVLTCP